MKHKISIIFVCTGNICRSPTAEAIFNNTVKKQNISHLFNVRSAGTHAMVGLEPDKRSGKTAKKHGITLDDITSEQFTKQDGEDFKYIIALDNSNYEFLIKNVSNKHKVYELASFIKSEHLDYIPDPYYNDNFEYVFLKIEEAIQNLIEHIKKAEQL